jgi:hypothetical protein
MDPAVAVTLRTSLALCFAVAALHKLRDVAAFRATLGEYRLLPAVAVPAVARAVPVAEAGVAAALVALGAPGLVAGAALLLVYAGAVGVNLARGRRRLDCGCAGPAARRPIGEWLVVRNVAVAAAALAAAAPVAARPLVWLDALTVAGGTLVAAAGWTALDLLHAAPPRRRPA